MKKRNVLLCGAFMVTALAVTGCKSTPKDVTVIKKDSNQMVAKAMSGKDKKYVLPKSYKDSFTNKKKDLKIKIDASFDMDPETGYPIVEVKRREFSEDEINKFIDVFTNGKPFYKTDDNWYKEDIQNRIIEIKKVMNKDGDTPFDDTQKKPSAIIKELKAKLKTAPDKPKEQVASKDMIPFGKNGGKRIYGYCKEDQNQKSYIQINDGCVGNEVNMIYTKYANPNQGNYMPDQDNMKYPKNIHLMNIKLSKEEASNQAKELLKKLNIKDMDVNCVVPAYDYSTLQEGIGNNKKTNVNAGYMVTFSRKINGLITNINDPRPSLVQLGVKDIDEVEYTDKEKEKNENSFSEPWMEERVVVVVDDTGVVGFRYDSPYEMGKVVINNSKLLKFEELKNVIKKMMLVKYDQDGGVTEDINIGKLKIGLQRVKVRGDKTKGLVVPIWTIVGDEIYDQGKKTESSMKDVELININAVDGSVVPGIGEGADE